MNTKEMQPEDYAPPLLGNHAYSYVFRRDVVGSFFVGSVSTLGCLDAVDVMNGGGCKRVDHRGERAYAYPITIYRGEA